MHLQVDWSDPIPMRLDRRHSPMFTVDLEVLPDGPGIYVFARRWGKTSFEALYVGKATNLRRRIKGQLNNLKLMQHVREARAGRRILFVGSLVTRPGQQVDRCLPIVERAFIRYFLSEGCDLVNIQGAKLRQHEIASIYAPRSFVPKLMYVDRSRARR